MDSLARTSLAPLPSPSWSTIVKSVLYSLKNMVQNYLKLGEGSLFDTREEPAGGWVWTSEDVQKNIDRIYLALKYFSEERYPQDQIHSSPALEHLDQIHSIRYAPFTIQRLVELVFHRPTQNSTSASGIHPHYTTLPKYLRAIQRVLSISSPVMSFSVNTFASSNLNEFEIQPPLSTHQSTPSVNGGHDHLSGTPSFPRARRHSTTTPITPILSPIPWLMNSNDHQSLSPEPTSSEGRRSRHTSPFLLSSGSDERPITPPLMGEPLPTILPSTSTEISPHSPTKTKVKSPAENDETAPSSTQEMTISSNESDGGPQFDTVQTLNQSSDVSAQTKTVASPSNTNNQTIPATGSASMELNLSEDVTMAEL